MKVLTIYLLCLVFFASVGQHIATNIKENLQDNKKEKKKPKQQKPHSNNYFMT